jgi:hypothetical protein
MPPVIKAPALRTPSRRAIPQVIKAPAHLVVTPQVTQAPAHRVLFRKLFKLLPSPALLCRKLFKLLLIMCYSASYSSSCSPQRYAAS